MQARYSGPAGQSGTALANYATKLWEQSDRGLVLNAHSPGMSLDWVERPSSPVGGYGCHVRLHSRE